MNYCTVMVKIEVGIIMALVDFPIIFHGQWGCYMVSWWSSELSKCQNTNIGDKITNICMYSRRFLLKETIQYNFILLYLTIKGPDNYTLLYLCSYKSLDHFNEFIIFFLLSFCKMHRKRIAQCKSEKNRRQMAHGC